jgi:hypothetical protein
MGRMTRRGVARVAAAGGAVAALSCVGASGQEKRSRGKRFVGTSKKGDLKEALDLAVKDALHSAPGADRQVRWTLKEISGVAGGIAGLREVTVAIEASLS